MSMSRIFAIFAVTFALQSTHALAQGAWGYLELLHSSSSTRAGDRWNDGEVSSEECRAAESEGKLCMAVAIPKELVAGREIEVVMTGEKPAGDYSPWQLKGPRGEAYCVVTGISTSCFISFKDLGVTMEDVDRHLAETIPDEGKRYVPRTRAQIFLNAPVLRYWHGIR